MKRKLTLSVLALALALGGASHDAAASAWCSGGVCQEWAARYDGGSQDEAHDIAVDASGNVYVTGQSYGVNNYDYVTIKYAPDGSQKWMARYDGSSHRIDQAYALAVDGSGNIYVTGEPDYFLDADSHYATIKYGPDGTEEWVARYDGPAGGSDGAYALAVDESGNVYVTGWSQGPDASFDYATIKYRADGSEEWVARYAGPAGRSDFALDLAVDGSGNVYVTGYSYMSSQYDIDYTTIKYGPDGTQQWVKQYDGPVGDCDEAQALALDGSGNVYVTGTSGCSVPDRDYATVKYGPDGAEEWVARYDGPASGGDEACDVGVDGSGNVYVTGQSAGSDTGFDYATIRYAPDGSEQWVARYDGPLSDPDDLDVARALAVDSSGNVYVTGKSFGSPSNISYLTVKYRPDGSQEWVAGYDGTAASYDEAHALTVDSSGNVYVTGQSTGSGTSYDYATVKYGPDSDQDALPDWYENAHACLDPLANDAASDPDADGLDNITEYGLGTDPCLADTDADGCADGEEPEGAPAPKPGSTGAYNPLAWYDFYDVPVPANSDPTPNGARDRAVTMNDVMAVAFYIGTFDGDGGSPNANGVSYDVDKGADTLKDGLAYDRSPSADPNPPWEAGPPSGALAMDDVLVVLAQVGLSCIDPP